MLLVQVVANKVFHLTFFGATVGVVVVESQEPSGPMMAANDIGTLLLKGCHYQPAALEIKNQPK